MPNFITKIFFVEFLSNFKVAEPELKLELGDLVPTHVRHKANGLVDRLANAKVKWDEQDLNLRQRTWNKTVSRMTI